MISKAAIERARGFVEREGRPVDRAYLDCLAPAGPNAGAVARLIAELTRFQTPEGGFGHGLEPDLRTPAPSAIATSVAFQYLRAVDTAPDLPMARAAIAYLVRTVDRRAWVWPAVDERVEEGPHAPWWTPGLDRFRGYVLNPSAELLGYLYDYRAHVPDDVLDAVSARVLGAVEEIGVIESAYELYCCMRLAQSKGLAPHLRDPLQAQLARSLRAADLEDAHLDLMRLVPTPSSFGYDIVRSGIVHQAERLVAAQAEDGGWNPSWEPWDLQAHREWRGWITSRAIVALTAHGFIET